MNLKETIRTVPNWPVEGVQFRDITTLIQNPIAFKEACDRFYQRYATMPLDKIVGIDARGFIFGSVLAYQLGVGFVPVRKQGKLPHETISATYSLEYGEDCVEIHADAIEPGERVLIVDDLLATGGTMLAAASLVEKLQGKVVECAVVIDLPDLKGTERLKEYTVFSLVEFEGE